MSKGADWRPTASLDALHLRAEVLAATRAFFKKRGVLEVEVPLLGATTVTDVQIESLMARDPLTGADYHLQPSPEYAMKRLVAAGSGPIYTITRAFRAGESGARHNPEFTMLEWYRPGFDVPALVEEVGALLTHLLHARPIHARTHSHVFLTLAGVDLHCDPTDELRAAAERLGGDPPDLGDDRDAWIDLLATLIEPELGRSRPLAVIDYPASQAALANLKRDADDEVVADRFEVFFEGFELANGYGELTDPIEQRRRFERDQQKRSDQGQSVPAIDERLIAALEAGLPRCAGVALGLDRLLMLASSATQLSEVLAFPIDRA